MDKAKKPSDGSKAISPKGDMIDATKIPGVTTPDGKDAGSHDKVTRDHGKG